MIQIPNIEQIQKGGLIAILLAMVLLLASVIVWFAKNYLWSAPKSGNGSLRELRAGEKDAEFWQKDYDARTAAQTKIIVEHLGKIRARLRDIDEKIVNFDTDVKREFQQVRHDMAMLARAIEMRDRE